MGTWKARQAQYRVLGFTQGSHTTSIGKLTLAISELPSNRTGSPISQGVSTPS